MIIEQEVMEQPSIRKADGASLQKIAGMTGSIANATGGMVPG